MRLLTLPQPKVRFKLCISIFKIKSRIFSKTCTYKILQGCGAKKTTEKTECPECDPIVMINNKLNKLIKCASKKESEAEVRILVRMMNHQMIMVIKKKIVNVSLVLCSNNQRYYILSSIHIYVAIVCITSFQECAFAFAL